jgi:hypothetical protein
VPVDGGGSVEIEVAENPAVVVFWEAKRVLQSCWNGDQTG